MENPNFLYHYIPEKYVQSFFKCGLLVRMAFDFSGIDPRDTQIPMNTKVEESVFERERQFLHEGIVKYIREAQTFPEAFEKLKFYANDSLKNYPYKLSDEEIYRFTEQLRDYKNDERKQLETYFEFEKEIVDLKNKSEYISCWSTQEILHDEKKMWEEHGRKGVRIKVRLEALEKMFQNNNNFTVQHKAVVYQPKETYEKNFKQEETQYDSKTRPDYFFIKQNDFQDEHEYRFLIKPSFDTPSALFNRILHPHKEKYLSFPEILENIEGIVFDPKCSPAEIQALKEFFPKHLSSSLD